MKIVYVTSEKLPVPPVLGGAVETWIYEVAQRIKCESAASLCVDVPQLSQWPHPLKFNLKTYRYGWLAKLMLCSYKLPFKNGKTNLFFYPYSYWCAKTANQLKADIIHNHSRAHFVPVLRRFNPKAKIILHVHNVSNFDQDGFLWPRKMIDQVDMITTCSSYIKEEMLHRYPYIAGKIQTLYNGVNLDFFNPERISNQRTKAIRQKYGIQPDEKIILFSGRLTEYKGAHVLIDAFKMIVKKFPDTRLLIVGGLTYSNNNETDYIRRLKASAKELKERVIFTGYIPHLETPEYLKAADLVVVPSLWQEPFGVVVIEAMAMGKPVVAFARGGIPEVISNGLNGVLLQETDVSVLAQACEELLAKPELRTQIGNQARKDVEKNFSWEKIVEDTYKIYHQLLNGVR